MSSLLGWKRRRRKRAGPRFMAQRPVCASIIVPRVLFIEGESAEFVLQWWWKGWRWVVGG